MKDEKAVIMGGDIHAIRYQSRVTIQRCGYNPFRISKDHSSVYNTEYGIAIQKNSPHKEMFKPVIMRLLQGDIIMQFIRASYYFWAPDTETNEVEPLVLSHLLMGNIAYFGGLFFALISFLLELSKPPKNQPKRKVIMIKPSNGAW